MVDPGSSRKARMSAASKFPDKAPAGPDSLIACYQVLARDSFATTCDVNIDEHGAGEATRALEWLKLQLQFAPLPLVERVCNLKDGALLQLLVRHAMGQSAQLQHDALTCITNIACGSRSHARALERGGAIVALCKCLSSTSRKVRTRAAWALSNLAGDGVELQNAVLSAGVLPPLLEMLCSETPAREFGWLAANLLEPLHGISPMLAVPDQNPPAIMCPITRTVICEPVCAADGHSYERSAIRRWFETRNTSPMTNLECDTKVVPNYALRELIRHHKCPQDEICVTSKAPQTDRATPIERLHSSTAAPDFHSTAQHCEAAVSAIVTSPLCGKQAAKTSVCLLQ